MLTAAGVASGLARRRRQRRFIYGIALVLLLAAAFVGWRLLHRAAAPAYATSQVTRGDITKGITASGTVNPETTVQVGSFISGSIQSVSCDFNTQVKKGQVCATIDPRPYQNTVDQDRANLVSAQAELDKDRTTLSLQQANFERAQKLLAAGLISQTDFDTAKANFEQAQSQIKVDQSTITQHNATLKSAVVNLGYAQIVSPVDGTVVSRNVTVGQTVAASFQTPTLFLIATDLTKMQVDISVAEGDIGGMKQGAPVTFTVEAFPNHRFNGEVTQVRQAPEAVQNVVTYDVVASVPNPELLLKPGMTANSRIVVDRRQNVLRVPAQALRYTPGGVAAAAAGRGAAAAPSGGLFGIARGMGGGGFRGGGGGGRGQNRGAGSGGEGEAPTTQAGRVYVLRNGEPVAVDVTTGLEDDTNTEIVSGDIHEGDQVIVSEGAAGASRNTNGRSSD